MHITKKTTVLLLLAFLVTTSCSNKKRETVPAEPQQPIKMVVGLGKIISQGGVSELASPTAGIVTSVRVKKGDHVKKGDILITLNNTSQLLAVNKVEKQIASQRESIQSAQFLIDKEKITVNDKKRVLDDTKELLQVGAATGENVRSLQVEYDASIQQLRKLESDLQIQRSRLGELWTEHASKAEILQLTTLTAPMDGLMLDITPLPGESLNQYQAYAQLAPESPLIVKAEIDELFATQLVVGQECTINLIGETQPLARGKILNISPGLLKKSLFADSGEDMEDRRVREIEVSIKGDQRNLLIDTKVECTIHLN